MELGKTTLEGRISWTKAGRSRIFMNIDFSNWDGPSAVIMTTLLR